MKQTDNTQGDELAESLHALRVSTGLNGKEFARQLGWDPSKVSRIENGRQRPSNDDIEKWARACGTPDETERLVSLLEDLKATHRAWRKRARAGHASVQADYNQLVARSRLISDFTTAFVPGLLQTPAYARRIFTEMKELHELIEDDVDKAVSTRLERQRHLYDDSKSFDFLLAEPVLLWGLCPADVMKAQLDRILTAAVLPNVRLAVLPLQHPLAVTPQNSFILYDDVAIIETFAAETICADEESALYRRIMDQLWQESVSGDAALALVHRAISQLT